MIEVSLQVYVYAFFIIIVSAIATFILVIRSLKGGGLPAATVRLYHAYYILGLIGWVVLGVKDTTKLGIDLTASSVFYITCGFVLLVAVVDFARKWWVLLIAIGAHLVFMGLSVYSPNDIAKLVSMSLYALAVYPIILLMSARRAIDSNNIGSAIIGAAALVIIIGVILQIFSLLILGNPHFAYGVILVTSSNAYVLVGIGFLTSIVVSNQKQLTVQALKDHLTGLHNRRGMYYAMQALLGQSERNHSPISVIAIDIDHFKKINDTYGHHGGDEVLKHVANCLTDCSRSGDICCRIGGEEFVIILPLTSLLMAQQVAERVRLLLEKQTISHGKHIIRLTASLGVASFSGSVNLDELLKSADRQLYRAKQEGRNRVCAAPAEPVEGQQAIASPAPSAQ